MAGIREIPESEFSYNILETIPEPILEEEFTQPIGFLNYLTDSLGTESRVDDSSFPEDVRKSVEQSFNEEVISPFEQYLDQLRKENPRNVIYSIIRRWLPGANVEAIGKTIDEIVAGYEEFVSIIDQIVNLLKKYSEVVSRILGEVASAFRSLYTGEAVNLEEALFRKYGSVEIYRKEAYRIIQEIGEKIKRAKEQLEKVNSEKGELIGEQAKSSLVYIDPSTFENVISSLYRKLLGKGQKVGKILGYPLKELFSNIGKVVRDLNTDLSDPEIFKRVKGSKLSFTKASLSRFKKFLKNTYPDRSFLKFANLIIDKVSQIDDEDPLLFEVQLNRLLDRNAEGFKKIFYKNIFLDLYKKFTEI